MITLTIITIYILFTLLIHLKVKKTNKNKYQLIYVQVHLFFIVLCAFVFMLIKSQIIPLWCFKIIAGMKICAITCFLLHVQSVITAKRVKINYVYILPIVAFGVLCIFNYFGIHILKLITRHEKIYNIPILDKAYLSDTVLFSRLIILIILITTFIIANRSKRFEKNKKKKHYLIFINVYLSLVFVTSLTVIFYYFNSSYSEYDLLFNYLTQIFSFLSSVSLALYPSIVIIIPTLHKMDINKLENSNEVFIKINDKMISEQLFLNKKLLTLTLCAKMDLDHKTVVSSILDNTQGNWKTYVNSFRIDFAIDLIKKGYLKRCSILSLAEESGFNSHQSFFRAFRAKTGMTPNKFYKTL